MDKLEMALESLNLAITSLDVAEEGIVSRINKNIKPLDKLIKEQCNIEVRKHPKFKSFYSSHVRRPSDFFSEEYVADLIYLYLDIPKGNDEIKKNITKNSLEKDCKEMVNALMENSYVMDHIGKILDEQISNLLRSSPHLY